MKDNLNAAKNIIVAKSAGFCFGVKRAVDKVYEQIMIIPCTSKYILMDLSFTMRK